MEVTAGTLHVGSLPAGAHADLSMPDALPPVTGVTWLTVRAALAADEPWAAAGHEVAWGQRLVAPAPEPVTGPRPTPVSRHVKIGLGAGSFDARTGVLSRLGDLDLQGPRLDVWSEPVHQRTISVKVRDDTLTVRTRVAPAGTDLGLFATFAWTASPDGSLTLTLDVVPDGDHGLPKLGVRIAALDGIEWFGRDPSGRVGRYADLVNGTGTEVRWAVFGDRLRVDGRPSFELADAGLIQQSAAVSRMTLVFQAL